MNEFVRLHHRDGSFTYLRAGSVLSITDLDRGCRVRADGIVYEVSESATEVFGLVARALEPHD